MNSRPVPTPAPVPSPTPAPSPALNPSFTERHKAALWVAASAVVALLLIATQIKHAPEKAPPVSPSAPLTAASAASTDKSGLLSQPMQRLIIGQTTVPPAGEAPADAAYDLLLRANLDAAESKARYALSHGDDTARAHAILANIRYEQFDVTNDPHAQQESRSETTIALGKDPDCALAHVASGNWLYFQKDYDGALREINTGIAHDPNLAYAFNERGMVYAAQKHYDPATAAFHQAIDLDHHFGWPYAWLGQIYFEQQRYDDAEQAWKMSLELNPNDSTVRSSLLKVEGMHTELPIMNSP